MGNRELDKVNFYLSRQDLYYNICKFSLYSVYVLTYLQYLHGDLDSSLLQTSNIFNRSNIIDISISFSLYKGRVKEFFFLLPMQTMYTITYTNMYT